MINNEKHKRKKKKRRDDDAITGLKTSEPRVSGEKRKKSPILSTPEGGHSIIWGQELQKALKPNCFFKYGFIHTWNRTARLGRRSKRSWWLIARKIWSCVSEAVIRQWKNLVVNAVLYWKRVQVLTLPVQSSLCPYSSCSDLAMSLLFLPLIGYVLILTMVHDTSVP